MASLKDEPFLLGACRVDPLSGTISPDDDEPTRVEPKAIAVLLHLVENRERVVSRQELLNEIWDGRFVTEDVLTGAISALRKAFGDSAKRPRYIQTVSGEGYRLVADVSAIVNAAARPRWAIAAIAIVMASVAALLAWGLYRSRQPPVESEPTPPARSTIAVLPFDNLSEERGFDFVARGLTDELITDLSRHPGLSVISRTSVLRFDGVEKPVAMIADSLGAELIVEGSVLRVGERVRVSAQLIDASSDRHLWAADYVRDVRDIFALMDELSTAIEVQVTGTIGPTGLVHPGVLEPEARAAYLRGRYVLEQTDPSALNEAALLFEKALRIEPDYAPLHLALAKARFMMGEAGGDPGTAMQAMRESALRASELDGDLSGAWTYLAIYEFGHEWEFDRAEDLFLRALRLNPNDSEAHAWYASFLTVRRRFDEAVSELRVAQHLDPMSYRGPMLARLLFLAGRKDEALSELEKAFDLDSRSTAAHTVAAEIHQAEGSEDTAIEHLRRALAGAPAGAAGLARLEDGLASFHQWRAERFREASDAGSVVPRVQFAAMLAAAGERDAALDLLEQALAERDMAILYIDVWPSFRSLRGETRFVELKRLIGLPG